MQRLFCLYALLQLTQLSGVLKEPLAKGGWTTLIEGSIRRNNGIGTLILLVVLLEIEHLVLSIPRHEEIGEYLIIDRPEILQLSLPLHIVQEGNVFLALLGLVHLALLPLVDLLLVLGYLLVSGLPLLVRVHQQSLQLVLLGSTAFADLPQLDFQQGESIPEGIYFVLIPEVSLGEHHIDFLLNAESTWRARIIF